jgi:hypothetical protein
MNRNLAQRLRRTALATLASASLAVLTAAPVQAAKFDLSTATIADIQAAMDKGTLTSEQLVKLYLARIDAYDQKGPKLNSVLTLNKKALETARALDKERREKGPRSPLHGVVILAKDVYDTADMPTTGGFKPMATSQPVRDSFIIDRQRRQHARWPAVVAVQPEQDHRRLQLRHRCRHRLLVRHRRPGQRHQRLHRHSQHPQQPGWLLHYPRPGQPHRPDVELAVAGKRRPDVPQRLRLRRDTRRHRRLRPG